MKINRFLKLVLASLLVLIFFASLGFAQSSKGTIAGTVTDASGAVVSGANVVAKSKDNGATRAVTSGASGSYRIEAVEPGTYIINVKNQGYQTLNLDNLKVAGSVITPVDFQLKVGGTSEVITVEATNNNVETETGAITGTIGTTEISQIALGTLNPIELVLTEPGVTDQGNRGISNGVNFSVDGGRTRSNNFLIDGQDNNDNSIQGQAFQPTNPQAISEVAILTNSYSAEYGRGGSSVTNVIFKGGTNQFHGAAWEYYDASGLNAVDPQVKLQFAPDPTPRSAKTRFNTHTFGFTIGGPIVKDKLFFFFSPQWQKFYGGETGNRIAVPTAAGIAALNSYVSTTGTNNAPLLLQYFSQAPVQPTGTGTCEPTTTGANGPCIEFATISRSVSAKSPDTQYNVRMDFLPTASDTLSLRYLHDQSSLSPDFFVNASALNGFDTKQGGPTENLGLTWTHAFNVRTVNEFRSSWGHFAFAFSPIDPGNPLFSLPALSITGVPNIPTLGVSATFPQGRGHQTYQFQDGLTLNRGAHILKMGADIARLIVHDQIPINTRGSITFGDGGGFTGLGNFLDNFTGGAGQAALTFGNPDIRPRMFQDGFYFQDTWKVKSNLTLDLGLRYEFSTNPENSLTYPGIDPVAYLATSTIVRTKVKEDRNNFAPRIGISYSPKIWPALFGENKTVIRAGYGVFYDSFFTNILDNSAAASPNAVSGLLLPNDVSSRGFQDATALPGTISPVLNPKSLVSTVNSNLKNPLTHQWNLNIERELPGKVLMTVAYTGNRGERLFANDQINPNTGFAPGTLKRLPRVNSARGSTIVRDNGGDSIYHGASIKLERKYSHGLLLRGAYTYGHAIDNTSDVFGTFAGNTLLEQYPPTLGNRAADRSSSNFDVRQRLAVTYVLDIPGFKSMKALDYITHGWQLSGTGSLQSGSPITYVINGIDTNGDGQAANDRPSIGNAAMPLTAIAIDGIFKHGTPGQLYDLIALNTSGALVPTTAAASHFVIAPGLGNVGRNTATDHGTVTWNTAVTRSFRIPGTETHAFQIRGDFFNVLNHPNNSYGVDNNLLDVSALGTNVPNQNTFMSSYYARNSFRKIRLEAKYKF